MTYLDWASTTPPDADLLAEAAVLAASCYGNPSSKHALGSEARSRLEEARTGMVRLFATQDTAGPRNPSGSAASPLPGNVLFTGSGSEADAMPLLALLRNAATSRRGGTFKGNHLVTTEIEHSAVYEEARLLKSMGIDVSFVRPEADGLVPAGRIAAALKKETALVAVMAVNNETGAIQELAGIAAAVAQAAELLGMRKPRLHTDAVQAFGKIPFQPRESGFDSAAVSAHKLRGPRGVGALWYSIHFETIAVGGGQEAGMRPGTENLQGAWAFSKAAEAAMVNLESRRIRARVLESRLLTGIGAIAGAQVLPLGRRENDGRYSPFILSVAFPGLSGEVLARALSDEGIAVSTGAACSSNTARKGRRILDAMGLQPDLSFSAIRISTGETTTEADIDLFLERAAALYDRLRI